MHHNHNVDITLLEPFITISVIFAVATFEDTFHLLQNRLTNQDERPCTP